MNDEQKKRKNLGVEQTKQAADLRTKFFFHWSILSGATITLIIPLITQIKALNGKINSICYIKIALILLLASLILSSVTNYLAANSIGNTGRQNIGATGQSDRNYILKSKYFTRLQKVIQYSALIGYILALIILYLFISTNLF